MGKAKAKKKKKKKKRKRNMREALRQILPAAKYMAQSLWMKFRKKKSSWAVKTPAAPLKPTR